MIGIRYYENGQIKYFLNYKVNSIWTLNFVYDFLSRFLTVTHLISLFTSVICIKVEKQVTGITNLSDKILILIYNKNSYLLEIILVGSFFFNLFNVRQHKIIIVSRLTKFLSRFLLNEGEQFFTNDWLFKCHWQSNNNNWTKVQLLLFKTFDGTEIRQLPKAQKILKKLIGVT